MAVVIQSIKVVEPQKEKSYTTYLVTSTTVNNDVFQVRRRYKEFKKLYETILRDMKFDNQYLSEFPKKDWMGRFDIFVIETRRNQFEKIMNECLSYPNICKSEAFLRFVGVKNEHISSTTYGIPDDGDDEDINNTIQLHAAALDLPDIEIYINNEQPTENYPNFKQELLQPLSDAISSKEHRLVISTTNIDKPLIHQEFDMWVKKEYGKYTLSTDQLAILIDALSTAYCKAKLCMIFATRLCDLEDYEDKIINTQLNDAKQKLYFAKIFKLALQLKP